MRPDERFAAAREPAPRMPSPGLILLEWVTSLLLLIVLASLIWMITVSYRPGFLRLASLEFEVLCVISLLFASLILVSLVSLLHAGD